MTTFSTLSFADHVDPRELQLKSAFIFKLAKFVQWPDGSYLKNQQTFNICIADNFEFTQSLTSSSQYRKIKNKTVRTWNVLKVDTINFCQIIYFHDTNPSDTKAYLDKIEGMPVLTIGSSTDFSKSGGIIRFAQKKNNISFEINNSLAKSNGLDINAHLLRLSDVK